MDKSVVRRLALVLVIGAGVVGTASGDLNSPHSDQAPRNPLGDWPDGASPAEVGRRVAENFAARAFERPTGFIIYPEVCAWYGSLAVARLTGDKRPAGAARAEVRSALDAGRGQAHFATGARGLPRLRRGAARDLHPDQGPEVPRSRPRLRRRQWETTTPDGITTEARYWIDDMFMITAVQVQAFRATGDARYLDRAALAMVAYLDKLQQPNGLFFHAPDSPFYWSRGNGWMAAGSAELLRSLPPSHAGAAAHPRGLPEDDGVAAVVPGRRRPLASARRPSGRVARDVWHRHVHVRDGRPASRTAGWTRPMYGAAVRKAWLGLMKYIDASGNISNVCAGTNKGHERGVLPGPAAQRRRPARPGARVVDRGGAAAVERHTRWFGQSTGAGSTRWPTVLPHAALQVTGCHMSNV